MTCTWMGVRPTSFQKNSGKNLIVMPLPSIDTTSAAQTVAAMRTSVARSVFRGALSLARPPPLSSDSLSDPPSVCASPRLHASAAGKTKKQHPHAMTTSSSPFRHSSPREAKTAMETSGPAALPRTLSADLRA